MQVRVVTHDPAWKSEFQTESDRLSDALGDIVQSVYHIGSTAIPTICAKPIIDILLEVDNIVRLDESRSRIVQLGYEALGEFGIPGRRYFRKDNASGVRTHQVHAFQADSPDIQRHIAFRDYMIAHPVEARRYGELKRKLAREHPDDIEAYMDGKDGFIKEHETKALAWLSSQISN